MLGCEQCNREIPTLTLWTALQRNSRLVCSACGKQVTSDYLAQRAEVDEKAKAILLAFGLLNTYGWVSYDALVNAGCAADPQTVGGLLTGLTRSGLIRRGVGKSSPLADIVDPKPVFVTGPKFPVRVARSA